MNNQQFNRANQKVFIAVIIVFAYVAFSLFAALGADGGKNFVGKLVQPA